MILTIKDSQHCAVKGDQGSVWIAGVAGFRTLRRDLARSLLDAPVYQGSKWQQLDVSESPAHATYELPNVTLWYDMPDGVETTQELIKPDLPWAEGHFLERVQGFPSNPGNWHHQWPYHAGGLTLHQKQGRYDHNYMERIWASTLAMEPTAGGKYTEGWPFQGYRFAVGDLRHVVEQLIKDPSTRQAYLPMWFPEDTGARNGQRVPCTLGWHFIIRDGDLHLQYNLRSCEVYRHWANDVYMAVRMAQWVRDQVDPDLHMGQLTMHMINFHGFVGDTVEIEKIAEYGDE